MRAKRTCPAKDPLAEELACHGCTECGAFLKKLGAYGNDSRSILATQPCANGNPNTLNPRIAPCRNQDGMRAVTRAEISSHRHATSSGCPMLSLHHTRKMDGWTWSRWVCVQEPALGRGPDPFDSAVSRIVDSMRSTRVLSPQTDYSASGLRVIRLFRAGTRPES